MLPGAEFSATRLAAVSVTCASALTRTARHGAHGLIDVLRTGCCALALCEVRGVSMMHWSAFTGQLRICVSFPV